MRNPSTTATKILQFILIACIAGVIFTSLINQTFNQRTILVGIVHAGLIGLFFAIFYQFNKQYIEKHSRNAPFIFVILGTSVMYLSLILFGRALGFMITHGKSFELWSDDENFTLTIIYAFITLVGYTFMHRISNLMGQNVLWNILKGKYRKKKKEFRFIMFLDIVASTKIAETIGDEKYLDLLDEFFYLISKPLLESKGVIYKYIGDEAIITWDKQRTSVADILQFYFEFKQIISANQSEFEQKYGWYPEFRAGLHADDLIIGEMGEVKKEIVLIGNSLNTTSRIVDFSKAQKVDIVISGQVKDLMNGEAGDYNTQSLGTHMLKGKEIAIALHAVTSK